MAWECQRWAGHLSWKQRIINLEKCPGAKTARRRRRRRSTSSWKIKPEKNFLKKIITSSHRSRRKRSKKTAYGRRSQMKRRPFLIFPSHFLYPFPVPPPPFSRPPPSSPLYFPQSDTCSGGARTHEPFTHPRPRKDTQGIFLFFLAPREIEGRRFYKTQVFS